MKKPDFKINIGDTVSGNKRQLLIIDREYRPYFHKLSNSTQNRKYYKYKCLDCGHEDWMQECRLIGKSKDRCNACGHTPHRLIEGKNDIHTLLPHIAKLFKDENEPKRLVRGSKTNAVFICPDCGREIIKRVDTVCANGLTCPCGDKWSYPNKYLYAFLEQTSVEFTPEKVFSWSEGRKYDEYIDLGTKKILIEMQGLQHYTKPIRKNGRTVEEEKKNDLLKYTLATENGITDYYIIDSRESNAEYIKKSLVNSGLLQALNVNIEDINWEHCAEFATSNFIKKVCNYHLQNGGSSQVIADKFKISRKTALIYLHSGNKFGWCNYDGTKERNAVINKTAAQRKKPVYCKNLDRIFSSAKEAAEYLDLPDAKYNGRSIRNAIKFGHPYLGYTFEFVKQDKGETHDQRMPNNY